MKGGVNEGLTERALGLFANWRPGPTLITGFRLEEEGGPCAGGWLVLWLGKAHVHMCPGNSAYSDS